MHTPLFHPVPDINAFKARNSIQPREHLKGSGADSVWHKSDSDGNRLNLNWNEAQLNCDNWSWDEKRNDNVGVLA